MIKREVIEHKICDLCKKEVTEINTNIKYPIIFTTEQTEGRPTKPYIENTVIDLCYECCEKVLKIKAFGACGNNVYEYKK